MPLHTVNRQCSSGLQAVASVAAAIKAGYYTVGLAGGVESMSTNPMAWEGGINPRVAECEPAQSCLIPMGESASFFPRGGRGGRGRTNGPRAQAGQGNGAHTRTHPAPPSLSSRSHVGKRR